MVMWAVPTESMLLNLAAEMTIAERHAKWGADKIEKDKLVEAHQAKMVPRHLAGVSDQQLAPEEMGG